MVQVVATNILHAGTCGVVLPDDGQVTLNVHVGRSCTGM